MNSFNNGRPGTGSIPLPTYVASNDAPSSYFAANYAGNSSGDLVSYIATSLPGRMNPNHVLLGLGVTFAGVVGGLIYWKSTLDKAPGQDKGLSKKPNPYLADSTVELEKSKSSKVGRGKSRLSLPQGVLILHQCPRGRKTPCIAPYPLKLETFLRMYGIKYEIDIDGTKNNNNADDQKSAFVTVDLEETQDTQNCVKFICEKYNLDPQKHLDERQKSLERAFLHLLEHHIYWGISLYRWVYDGARSLEKIQYLPPATIASIPNVCRTVEQAAWFHGIGKKAPADVVEDIIRDLASMSRLLGEKKYFLSNTNPTELDCTAFAMLAQMYWTMEESPYYASMTGQYKNLADFCNRIKQEFWPDWEQCLNNTPVLD